MSKVDSPMGADVVRQLADILNETGLSEIEYEKDECRIRVARQITAVQENHVIQAGPVVHHGLAMSPVAANSSAPAPEEPIITDVSKHPGAVKSPMVGNAYLSPGPGSDPFIRIGDTVKAGDNILIIEAMKVMNQIKAPKDGVVKEIFIQDADPVEFDQVLVLIA